MKSIVLLILRWKVNWVVIAGEPPVPVRLKPKGSLAVVTLDAAVRVSCEAAIPEAPGLIETGLNWTVMPLGTWSLRLMNPEKPLLAFATTTRSAPFSPRVPFSMVSWEEMGDQLARWSEVPLKTAKEK